MQSDMGVRYLEDRMFIFQAHILPLDVILHYKALCPFAKINLLRAYGKPSHENSLIFGKYRHLIHKIILDSGAWTKNNAKNPAFDITLDGYIQYLKKVYTYFDFVINYDCDFNKDGFETNFSNQRAIEEAGFEIGSVVHNLQGGELDFHIERRPKIINIGSNELVRPNYNLLYPIFRKCFDAGIKIHTLGSVRYNPYAFMPVYSCDTSNWNQAGGRGYMYWWNPKKSGVDKTDQVYFEDNHPLIENHIYFGQYEYREDLEVYLWNDLQLTYTDLMGHDRFVYRRLVNLHYYVELEKRMTRKQRELGFVFDE